MSEVVVKKEKIKNIIPHRNADRLELAIINGWQIIIQKDSFKVNDEIVFIPIDTILPDEFIDYFNLNFVRDNRVRAIKLRKEPSYGICLPVIEIEKYLKRKIGNEDLKDELGIKKYIPKENKNVVIHIDKKYKWETNLKRWKTKLKFKIWEKRIKKYNFDCLKLNKYTSIANMRNHMTVFKEDDEVLIHEKIHGMNARFGKMICFNENNNIFKIMFGNINKPDYFIGSHNVSRPVKDNNTWSIVFNEKKEIKELLDFLYEKYEAKQVIIFGEIYGKNIQDLEYSKKDIDFIGFDIMIDGIYIDIELTEKYFKQFKIETVPKLYEGKFNFEIIKFLDNSKSKLDNKTLMEGVIITSKKEERCRVGRKKLKYVFDSYLTRKNGTEYK